jgi:hypothetical protein
MIFGSNKIMLSDRPQEPQFCTCVLTNAEGTKDYCHVLISSELISPSIIEETTVKALNSSLEVMMQLQGGEAESPTLEEHNADSTEPRKYVSIAFCMRSRSEHIQGLREVLEALNNNIFHIFETNVKLGRKHFGRILGCSETLRNMLWLLNETFNPPPEVSLTLKLGCEEVTLPTDPLFGLSHSEYCVKVLFDVLDVAQIIALYTSLMLEQRVIVISRQRNLLSCICEALRSLMFPLTWMNTYVPCISEHLLDQVFGCLGIYFFGVSAYLSVEDLSTHFEEATILDIATSYLYVPKSSTRLCPLVEAKLRRRLQALKNPHFRKFDEVELMGKKLRRTGEDDVFEMLEKGGLGRNLFVNLVRQTFLQLWMDALKNLNDFVTRNSLDENEFNLEAFLSNFEGCADKKCTCEAYWSSVIKTNDFDDFVRQSRWLNDSRATDLHKIFKPEGEEDPEVYEFTLQPILSLTKMLDDLIELFSRLSSEDQSDHAIKATVMHSMKNMRSQIELYSSDISNETEYIPRGQHSRRSSIIMPKSIDSSFPLLKVSQSDAYTGLMPQFSLRPVALEALTEVGMWYGRYGLLGLLRGLEVLEPEELQSMSCADVLIEQLYAEDSPSDSLGFWQKHLIKAQILELSQGAPEDIVDEYVKACVLQPHCLPQFKFALHLSDLIVIKRERVKELVGSKGTIRKIAKAVWDDKESQVFEMSAAKVQEPLVS